MNTDKNPKSDQDEIRRERDFDANSTVFSSVTISRFWEEAQDPDGVAGPRHTPPPKVVT